MDEIERLRSRVAELEAAIEIKNVAAAERIEELRAERRKVEEFERGGLSLGALRAASLLRQKEWNAGGGSIDLAFRGNELAGEVGEACNIIKKLERERLGIRGSRATVAQLAEELADVVICADLIAMATGIDLGAATVAKFNATSEKVGLSTRLGLL